MFSWLTKQRKPVEPDRDIFEYWDGIQCRKVDPLPVWYAFWEIGEIRGIMDKAANGEAEATRELTQAARDLFAVQPYNPAQNVGLTELEVQKLLMKFLEWCNHLKKKHGLLPLPWEMLAPSISSDPSTMPPDAESSSSQPPSPTEEPSTVYTPSPQPSAEA